MTSERFETKLNPSLTTELREGLIELWVNVSRAGGAVGFASDAPVEEIREVAESHFAKIQGGSIDLVIATRDENVIGACMFVRNSLTIQLHFMELKRFMIDPAEQGAGLGRQLADRALDIARDELKLEDVHITVRSETGLDRFWSKCGFELVGTIPRTVKLGDNDYRDSLYFVQSLTCSAADEMPE